MDRDRLRLVREIREDLAGRAGGGELLREADRLVRFYARAVERGDVLVTEPRAYPPGSGSGRRRKPRRKRRHKPVTEDYVLAILREAGQPLTTREIGERLEAQGREALTRQGMSYVLRELVRQGKAERQEVVGGPHRCVWRATH
ncbi:MAG TPA: hypothetical protein VLF66_09285 [Thermoanaerobaculia bacterium]|nr:hypothetical protein [Thermoanaerobaculia bacterium]